MREMKQYWRVVCIGVFSLGLQACSTGSKMAMDYLPDTARFMIEKDIESGHQVDEEGTKPVSVKTMLANILGFGDEKSERKIPVSAREPITTTFLKPSALNDGDLVTPSFENVPVPSAKPKQDVAVHEILDVIDLPLDEQTVAAVREKIQIYVGGNATAEISVGPVVAAENLQLASLHAMAKAGSIGRELKANFSSVSIKFDPLLPRDTLKIVIRGKKRDA